MGYRSSYWQKSAGEEESQFPCIPRGDKSTPETPGLIEALITNSHCTLGFFSVSRRISPVAQGKRCGERQGLREKVCLLGKSYKSTNVVKVL